MTKKIEKVVLVALTEKEVKFINSLTRPIHNRLLEEDRKRGYVTQHSDETRTLTGSIGKKLLFQSCYSTSQKTLERDLARRLKAYKDVEDD